MNFVSTTALILAILACGCLSLSIEDPIVTKILAQSPLLSYLGRVESKRFFHVNSSRTWQNSNEYCQELGMNLVAIENQEEYTFLKDVPYPNRWETFWISARDSGSRAQYVWNSGQSIGNFGQWRDEASATDFTCIYMSASDGPGSGRWREYGCLHGHTSVCQLVV